MLLTPSGVGGLLNNVATSAPTSGDDESKGYDQGSIWVDTSTSVSYICIDASIGSAVWKALDAPWVISSVVPTPGQVTFIVPSAPSDPNSLRMYVNGIVAEYGTEFTVSGTTVTWLNTLFSLTSADSVEIWYQ